MFKLIEEYLGAVLIAILTVAWIVIGFWFASNTTGVTYDCRLSEISPDFPPEVKEQCRKLRATSGRI